MYRAHPFQRISSEEHSQHMPFARAKFQGIGQSRISLREKNTYAVDMASFSDPKMNLPKKKIMAKQNEVGSVDHKYSSNWWSNVKDSKSKWVIDTEPNFPWVFPLMSYGRKLGSCQDEHSLSMYTSSSKRISGDSVEFGKYQDFDNFASHRENHLATCDSHWELRSSSAKTCYSRPNVNTGQIDWQDHCCFELIKAQCLCDPKLMAKVVKWSVTHTNSSQISHEDIMKLSRGRLWIDVRFEKCSKDIQQDSSQQETLDNLKGAYQEIEPGFYKQPKAHGLDGGMQHTLLKDSVGLWVIHKYDPAIGVWSVAAKEFPNGRWVESTFNRTIDVALIPMQRILGKLRNEASGYQEVAKHMEFLFTSCDQSKLNGKLKSRNLKHNINNLNLKLDKQYALNFAITVANIAEEMIDVSQISDAFQE